MKSFNTYVLGNLSHSDGPYFLKKQTKNRGSVWIYSLHCFDPYKMHIPHAGVVFFRVKLRTVKNGVISRVCDLNDFLLLKAEKMWSYRWMKFRAPFILIGCADEIMEKCRFFF